MAGNLLMLANVYKPEKHSIGGTFVSEKLDGTRCFWDGGISRGVDTVNVPWANTTDPKTGERKKKIIPKATGLWSRYGNPIVAPDWFLNKLPCCPLDGELWAGRGNFQESRSIVGRETPDERWRDIQFVVFGAPSPANVFATRAITGANIKLSIDAQEISSFIQERREYMENFEGLHAGATFEEELRFLQTALGAGDEHVYMHRQSQLSMDEVVANEQLKRMMGDVLDNEGEGLMIRRPDSLWLPKRSNELLKVKRFLDDTAVLTGFTSGRETNKGSKHRGKIGALITKYKGKRLELSGMTDVQRLFLTKGMEAHAYDHPGTDMPDEFQGMHFKTGDEIEFRYTELSDDGIPKVASFVRVL